MWWFAVALPLLLGGLLLSALPGAAWAALQETPFFQQAVADGTLPKIEDRVPSEPAVVDATGKPGGQLRMLMATPKDTRMMVVYGYARLVGDTPAFEIEPDILKSIDVEQGRAFTLHLRKGMKWSDGHPFTAEDFRYWFEDVAKNPKLAPSGLPVELLPKGQPPRFEVLDDTTVRYSWAQPNPLFLPALAGPDPLFIYCPSHYLKQFNAKYADKEILAALVKKARVHNWAALHNKKNAMYRDDNPELPTLEPWVLKTKPPALRYVFERNPYYYRVDMAGRQLPYIDQVILSLADGKIIPAKTAAGESDLQARYLSFDDYTFLRQSEDRATSTCDCGAPARVASLPSTPISTSTIRSGAACCATSAFAERCRSPSIGTRSTRCSISDWRSRGRTRCCRTSPLYQPGYRSAWAQYDFGEANRLLDVVGLSKRNSDGVRLLPDGRPMEIVVEDSGEWTGTSDVLELIRDSWRHIGIRLFAKPLQLTLFRRRVFSGETLMSIDKGIENGLANALSSPWEFAPTSQQQLEWPKWGQYYETKGAGGEAPDLPSAIRLRELYETWLGATSRPTQTQAWRDILQVWADEVFSIGTVGGVLQPVVVSNNLRGIPEEGIYNWEPGAFFGIYKPDHFWFGPPPPAAKSASAAVTPPPHP